MIQLNLPLFAPPRLLSPWSRLPDDLLQSTWKVIAPLVPSPGHHQFHVGSLHFSIGFRDGDWVIGSHGEENYTALGSCMNAKDLKSLLTHLTKGGARSITRIRIHYGLIPGGAQ
ncbi:MAG: hypothetical protein EOP85_02870 [Verrucomicrobiaceae bacterium]|nr:MAG: hypothetical protein EOP85_02870 [Verrucomicrobiaceae bacterium]